MECRIDSGGALGSNNRPGSVNAQNMGGGGTPMDDLQRLVAIEDIRRTKTRYWNGMDFKDRALMRSAFADGAVDLNYRISPDDPKAAGTYFINADDCVRVLSDVLLSYTSSHQGHSVEVDFLSDTEAKGVWSFSDRFWFKGADESQMFPNLGRSYRSWGHYHDIYRKSDKGWRIAATAFRTLHIERTL